MDYELHIKNMVCDRCVTAVTQVLRETGLEPRRVTLGRATLSKQPTPGQAADLRQRLHALGFELLESPRMQLVDSIRTAVIELARGPLGGREVALSDYLARRVGRDYSALSKLFSDSTGKTIVRYYMEQRVERAKELIDDGQLTLKEIAYRLGYSSTAYFSTQFKLVTGESPSNFKQQHSARLPLDRI